MKKILCSLLLLFTFVFPAYAEGSQSITQEQAIEIAKQYAITNKKMQGSWFGGRVSAVFEDNKWWVFFEGKPDEFDHYIIGDHFLVTLSAEGKVLRFSPGL